MSQKHIYCPECKQKSNSVALETVKNQLIPLALRTINAESPYYYCETPECLVVYFSPKTQQHFKTNELHSKIFAKDRSALVCACFGYTTSEIQQAKLEGKAIISVQITHHTKAGRCSCISRNPSGKCCLGKVKQIEEKA